MVGLGASLLLLVSWLADVFMILFRSSTILLLCMSHVIWWIHPYSCILDMDTVFGTKWPPIWIICGGRGPVKCLFQFGFPGLPLYFYLIVGKRNGYFLLTQIRSFLSTQPVKGNWDWIWVFGVVQLEKDVMIWSEVVQLQPVTEVQMTCTLQDSTWLQLSPSFRVVWHSVALGMIVSWDLFRRALARSGWKEPL